MEYVKGNPYFSAKQCIKQYQYLDHDLHTDVLIVGGGINGAILNNELSKHYDVTLVDKGRLCRGCTACATSLLEYQLDDYADELLSEMTEDEIVATYKMGLSSLEKLYRYITKHGNFCDYSPRPTLMYTDNILNKPKIEKEYEFRKRFNFDVKYIERANNPFPFDITAGILAENGGAEFNSYLFGKQMLEGSKNQDSIYENTKIVEVKKYGDTFKAKTNFGETIFCNRVVYATGFNWEIFDGKKLCDKVISYSIVTEPIKDFSWYKQTLIQDDLAPYHYLRTLPNGRLIYGGEDAPYYNRPISSATAEKKYKKLEKDLKELFSHIKDDIRVEYKFCGAFGSTANNLGLIGETAEKGIYFFLSCGANGIINALYGTELMTDLFENRPNALEHLFSPQR